MIAAEVGDHAGAGDVVLLLGLLAPAAAHEAAREAEAAAEEQRADDGGGDAGEPAGSVGGERRRAAVGLEGRRALGRQGGLGVILFLRLHRRRLDLDGHANLAGERRRVVLQLGDLRDDGLRHARIGDDEGDEGRGAAVAVVGKGDDEVVE